MGCFSKIWSRYSLKPSYIRECLRVKCREYGSHLPDIRPRGDADYVVVGRWMIARRLAVLAAGFLGLGSLWVILACLPARSDRAADGVSTYRYNALPLRFKSGRVAILGKSGYLAYEGEVEDGAANGTGVLYAPDGDVVYRGGFSQNQYSGFGERYYPGNGRRRNPVVSRSEILAVYSCAFEHMERYGLRHGAVSGQHYRY